MSRRAMLVLVGFAAAVASTCAQAEPLKIRMDWGIIPGHFAALIPTVPKYNADVYRHYGKSYTVEPVRLQGGGASLTALAAGELDIAAIVSPQTLVLAVAEAKLDIKIIGQALTTEMPGYLQTQFWVRKGEVFGLTVDRLDMLRREVHVDRQLVGLEGVGPRFGPPKTSASARSRIEEL